MAQARDVQAGDRWGRERPGMLVIAIAHHKRHPLMVGPMTGGPWIEITVAGPYCSYSTTFRPWEEISLVPHPVYR